MSNAKAGSQGTTGPESLSGTRLLKQIHHIKGKSSFISPRAGVWVRVSIRVVARYSFYIHVKRNFSVFYLELETKTAHLF